MRFTTERYTAKNEKNKQKAKEFAERKRAGLARVEELVAEAQRLAKRAEYNKTYRDTRMANQPPKPPRPPKPDKLTTSEVLRKYNEGHDLTPEEQILYDDYREIRRGVSKRQYQKRKVAAALVEKPPCMRNIGKRKPSISVNGAMIMMDIIGITNKNVKLQWRLLLGNDDEKRTLARCPFCIALLWLL